MKYFEDRVDPRKPGVCARIEYEIRIAGDGKLNMSIISKRRNEQWKSFFSFLLHFSFVILYCAFISNSKHDGDSYLPNVNGLFVKEMFIKNLNDST